jgi:REase_DpnII-MboI
MPGLSINQILNFLSRFDRMAGPLASRTQRPFKLEDESDVRDLAYAALKPFIGDLEREPTLENVASTGGRPDLASRGLGLVIEVKALLKESRQRETAILKECPVTCSPGLGFG